MTIYRVIIILLVFHSCTTQVKENDNLVSKTEIGYKKYAFNRDNFGFSEPEFMEPGDGINSLTFNDNLVFLSDGLNQNIKMININSGELKISDTLSYSPIDLMFCNNKIFIASRGNDITIMDLEMNILSDLETTVFGEKFFYKDAEEDLFVYYPSEGKVQKVNCDDLKLGTLVSSDVRRFTGNGIARGKAYHIDSTSVDFQFGRLQLRTPYQNLYRYYNALNIDFDQHMLVQYGFDPDNFWIEIYKF